MSDEENMQPSCCQPEQPLEADNGVGCCEPEECCSPEPATVKDENEGGNEPSFEQLQDEVLRLQQQVEQSTAQAQEYKELLQRVQADFDNYRRRNANAVQESYKNGMFDAIEKLLPVLDNLERAISVASASKDFEALVSGVGMVIKQFNDILAKMGVEEIEALGKPFDPNLHDAIMTAERQQDQEPNVVVEVLQKGYKVKDKVLRHSLVKVTN